ncbi:MAG TPA: hypothetical protein VK463_10060 [Desulfomonilaceae bacterium]|nr:hypothetical protein [Desulfomonilaceae bacterium]
MRENENKDLEHPVTTARSGYFWLGFITVVTLLHWVILCFHLPVFTRISGWFFPFTSKPWGAPWLILALVGISVIVLAWLVPHTRIGVYEKLVLLIILGFGLQHGFALLEGRGIDGIRDRMVHTMHAEFPEVAIHQESAISLISNFEHLADSGILGICARVKPPGQILLYMANERMARLISPQTSLEGRLAWFKTFASYFWPFWCYLTIIPLYFLCRSLLGTGEGMLPCMLYLYVPSVNLITLHTDQAFFPFFSVACLLCASIACSKRSFSLAFVTGCLLYGIIFLSFGLMLALCLVAAILLSFSIEFRPVNVDVRLIGKFMTGMVLGLLVADICSRVFLNYDIFLRYHKSTAYHSAWKSWTWDPKIVFGSGVMNLLEFTVWVGFPLAILGGLSFFRSVDSLLKGKPNCLAFLNMGLFMSILAAAFFGGTAGEEGRLLIFLVPLVCLSSGHEILTRFSDARTAAVALILILQGGTVYFTKVFQDFY